jgi:hypothetical protein
LGGGEEDIPFGVVDDEVVGGVEVVPPLMRPLSGPASFWRRKREMIWPSELCTSISMSSTLSHDEGPSVEGSVLEAPSTMAPSAR